MIDVVNVPYASRYVIFGEYITRDQPQILKPGNYIAIYNYLEASELNYTYYYLLNFRNIEGNTLIFNQPINGKNPQFISLGYITSDWNPDDVLNINDYTISENQLLLMQDLTISYPNYYNQTYGLLIKLPICIDPYTINQFDYSIIRVRNNAYQYGQILS